MKNELTASALPREDLEALRRAVTPGPGEEGPIRWNASPDEVQQSVAKLVLTLAEFLRQVLERQAIRRMEQGTFTDDETESVGLALMRVERALRDVAGQFGLTLEELNLDLGPMGRLR